MVLQSGKRKSKRDQINFRQGCSRCTISRHKEKMVSCSHPPEIPYNYLCQRGSSSLPSDIMLLKEDTERVEAVITDKYEKMKLGAA